MGTEAGAGSSSKKPVVHGFVTNMKGMSGGDIIWRYKGPLDEGRYAYFYYQHKKTLPEIKDGDYNDASINCKEGRGW